MKKSDKLWEVQYETNQEGWRTKMRVVAKSKTSAVGKVAIDVTRALNNDVWFRYKDCINVTEQTHNGAYKHETDTINEEE